MKNGPQDSIDESLKKYETDLDNLIEKIGISYTKDEEAIQALSLSYQQLKKMDQQECCVLSYQIQQYGLYIQSLQNRLINIQNWCQKSLEILVAKYCKPQPGVYLKYEEKLGQIIVENTAGEYLNKLLMKATSKARELSTLTQKISKMSDTLIELSKAKRNGYQK